MTMTVEVTGNPEQPLPRETTAEVLVSMLTENTGRHFLDSGGAYGRNWERNHNKGVAEFEAEPATKTEFYLREGEAKGEITITISLYHWLKDRLDINHELDAFFFEWVETQNARRSWFDLVDRFVGNADNDLKEFIEGRRVDVADDEGEPEWEYRTRIEEALYEALEEHNHLPDPMDNSRAGFTHNTYNGEDALSQTIQYTLFDLGYGDVCCFLFIHGGCDVRGGYTRPRAFDVGNGSGWESFLDNARVVIGPNPTPEERDGYLLGHPKDEPLLPGVRLPPKIDPWDVTWDSDNAGYSFYPSGNEHPAKLFDLGDYEWSEDPEDRGKGFVYFDRETSTAYCPVTGFPLVASWF